MANETKEKLQRKAEKILSELYWSAHSATRRKTIPEVETEVRIAFTKLWNLMSF